MVKMTVRKSPCTTCPYRRDVPSGVWDESEYAKLADYDGDIMEQAVAGATGMFCCHQRTGEVCAGWAGCYDLEDILAARLAYAQGKLDPSAFEYESPVPLFGSGAEAAKHGMRDIRNPDSDAQARIVKLRRLRAAKGQDW